MRMLFAAEPTKSSAEKGFKALHTDLRGLIKLAEEGIQMRRGPLKS